MRFAKRRTSSPHRLRPVIEALEPRAMLAGVGPESLSAGGIGTPLMGAGALLTSGTILTCSSPTPGSSGTASLPGSTGGSGGSASGGVLWLPSTAGSGAGTSSSGSTGAVNTNGPALSSQVSGGSGAGGQGANAGSGSSTQGGTDLWLSYSAGSGVGASSSGSAGAVNTNGPALSSQVGGGSVAGGQGANAGSGSSAQGGNDLWLPSSAGSGPGTSSSGSTGTVNTNGPALSSRFGGGSGPGGQGASAGTGSSTQIGDEFWLSYRAGSGAGTSSSGSAGTLNTNGPALSSQVGGSGDSQSAPPAASGSGRLSVVLFDSAQPSRTGSGTAPGSTGSNTLTLEEGVPPPRLTPLVLHPGSDDGPGFVSGVWTGDEGGVQFVLAAEQEKDQTGQPLPIGKPGTPVFIVSGSQPGSQVPFNGTTATTTPADGGSVVPPSGTASYSVFSAVGGLFNVIGGASQAAVGVNVVTAASAATLATDGGALPLTGPIIFGGSVVVVHGLDQVWAGVTTIYTGQTQRPYTAQALDPLTGNETRSDWINGGFGIVLSGGAGLLARGTQVAGQVASKGDEIATAVGAVADDGANAGATALNTAANSKAQFSHIDFGGHHTLTAGQGTKLRFTVSGEKMWVDMWEATNSALKRQGIGGRSLFEEALRRFPDVREIRGIAELDNLAAFRATGDVNKTPFALSLRKLGFTRFEAIEVSGDIVLIAGR